MNESIKKKGVTLIELIVVIAIIAIVFSIINNIFSFQSKIYNTEMVTNAAQNSGTLCINSLSNGISLASNVTPYDPGIAYVTLSGLTGNCKQIVGMTPYGGVSTYQYVINGSKLYKYVSGTSYYLIASNVNKITVTLSGSIYSIYVEISNGSSIKTFTTSVSLRNRSVL